MDIRMNLFCDMCNKETSFDLVGCVTAGYHSKLDLENWQCPCAKFNIMYAKSLNGRICIISRVYSHPRISIMISFDNVSKDMFEVKLSKQGSDINIVYDPRGVDFTIDPIHPDEDIILQKIEMYEIFS